MIITTTDSIDGKRVTTYHGIVSAEVILGANVIKDLFASVTDFVGGRSGTYEKVLADGKEMAMQDLEERAAEMGANAIVGVDLDYETIGEKSGMLMVVANGTAVTVG